MTVETVIAVAMVVVMISKKGSRGNDRFDKNRRYRNNKDNKKPHNTSSEKKTGFVIRNKGDK